MTLTMKECIHIYFSLHIYVEQTWSIRVHSNGEYFIPSVQQQFNITKKRNCYYFYEKQMSTIRSSTHASWILTTSTNASPTLCNGSHVSKRFRNSSKKSLCISSIAGTIRNISSTVCASMSAVYSGIFNGFKYFCFGRNSDEFEKMKKWKWA